MTKAAEKKKGVNQSRVGKVSQTKATKPKAGNWRDVMSKALETKRPAEGWPDPKSKYQKPNQPKKR
jgi:hypothetical protein